MLTDVDETAVICLRKLDESTHKSCKMIGLRNWREISFTSKFVIKIESTKNIPRILFSTLTTENLLILSSIHKVFKIKNLCNIQFQVESKYRFFQFYLYFIEFIFIGFHW